MERPPDLQPWLPRALGVGALVVGWLVGCAGGGPNGANGQAGASSSPGVNIVGNLPGAGYSPDPNSIWGVIQLPSPSPGDTNPLQLALNGQDLVYTVMLSGVTAPKVVTYNTVRDADYSTPKPVPGATPTTYPSPVVDRVQEESSDVDSHFEIRVTYKRFFHGDYTVTAIGDINPKPVGVRHFHVE